MAYTKMIAVEGLRRQNEVQSSALTQLIPKDSTESYAENNLFGNMFNKDWLEQFLSGRQSASETINYSRNFASYLCATERGNQRLQKLRITREFGTKKLIQHGLMNETEFTVKHLNKVFCSTWLNDRQIMFGTKCNKLLVLDIATKKMVQIPTLKSNLPPISSSGIHALRINPSRTYVATSADNSNEVAVYKLPTLDPVFVGEGAHTDWVFDITWLDDEFFVSGSRDSTIALWRVQDSDSVPLNSSGSSVLKTLVKKPLKFMICRNAEKVRALLFNDCYQELVALSLNACLHLWDAQTFKQKFTRKLPKTLENVCLAQQADYSLYAVGSRSHVTLLDTRTLETTHKIPTSKYNVCSVRSLSFMGDLLTLGTGVGTVLFYDVRGGKYIEMAKSSMQPSIQAKKQKPHQEKFTTIATLSTTRGWVYPDEFFQYFHLTMDYNPAIYTHCYDTSGTRLFMAGGPLPVQLQGSYAAIWQ